MSKNKNLKKYIGLIGILFLFPLAWILFFGVGGTHHFKTLGYVGPGIKDTVKYSDYVIPDFAFENQYGQVITSDSLKGKIWMAAFFSMKDEHVNDITERLLNINWRYRNEPDVWIVCFSTDGANDIPALTKPYVEKNTKYNRFPNKWQFLRGDQPTMDSFIRNGFLIDDLSKEAIFRLVDEKGQIRALYGNTEFHFKSASEDIALLKKEIDLRKYNERKQKEQ